MTAFEIHHEAVKAAPIEKTTTALAKELGCSPATVWRIRQAYGIESKGRPGTARKDRSHWDWSLRDVELARIHGLTRQRIHSLRKLYRNDSKAGTKAAPYGETSSDRESHQSDQSSVQGPGDQTVEQSA